MKTSTSVQDRIQEGVFSFALGEYEKSVTHFSKAIEGDPDSHLAYLSRGVAYAKMEKMDLAQADFDRAIQIKHEDPRAYHFRGLTQLRRGDRENARKDFDKAIELNPGYGVAYFSRGTTLSEMGEMERAGKDMVTAARIGETNLQGFADYYNIWRTRFDKVEAELTGERRPDVALKPDMTAWLD
jgi:Tfp pilus assembly protein PilF